MPSIVCCILLLLSQLAASCTCRDKVQTDPSSPAAPAARENPVDREAVNLVLISMDTLRRDRVTAYGYRRNTTPAIEKLAEKSVIFDSAISQNTNTAPSHATMFTGLYPTTHAITRNGMRLRREVKTLASILKQRGYATAGFISGWSLSRHTGLQQGFDLFEDRFSGSRRPGEVTWGKASKWLRERGSEPAPFFLFLHLFDPHAPYDPPHKFVLRFLPDIERLITLPERKGLPGLLKGFTPPLTPREIREYEARYDGELVYSDRIVGKLMKKLKQMGALERSLIVFLSDHGETLFERAWVTDHGGRAYEEQIRVPLIVRFPDARQAGKRVAEQVELVDLLPTVLQTLKLEIPEGLAGHSLLPLVDGTERQDAPRPAFSSARPEPVRVPEISAPLITAGMISVLRLPSLKLIEYPMAGGGWYRQLFDLKKDPLERENLASEKPLLAEKLHLELERWRAATGEGHRAPPPVLSPEIEKALRALGYVE